jgi:hypothetical protein
MSGYGDEWTKDSPFENPRFVMLRQGVLMGDPLTKVCLHLVNILVRTVASNYGSESFIRRVFPFNATEIRQHIDSFCSDPAPPTFNIKTEERYDPGPSTSGSAQPIGATITPITNVELKPHKSPKKEKYVPQPKAMGFELTCDWLKKRPVIQVESSSGSVLSYQLGPLETGKPATRSQIMKSAELRNFLAARQERAQGDIRVREEELRRTLFQQGMTFNSLLTPRAVTPVTADVKPQPMAKPKARGTAKVPIIRDPKPIADMPTCETCSIC